MYQFTDKLNVKEFDDFAGGHHLGSFFQTSGWSHVKDNWTPIYVGLYKEGVLVAASLVLKRTLFLNYTMLYAPRGPLLDYNDEEVLKIFFKHLEELAKQEHAFVFKIDPHVIRSSEPMYNVLNDGPEQLDDHVVNHIKSNTEFKHAGFLTDMYAAIQPRFEAVVYFDEWWDANKHKTRGYRNAKQADKLNVKVREVMLDEIDVFESVMKKTEEYKEIDLRDKDYYSKLKQSFGEDCYITVAYLDVTEEIKHVKERIKDFDQRLANPQLKEPRRKDYLAQQNTFKKDLDELEAVLRNSGGVVYLAGGLSLKSDNKAELLYAGMDRDFAKYNASDLIYTNNIAWAQNQGCQSLSFGGVNGGLENGLTKYKLTFSPRMDELIGEFSYVSKPFVNTVFNFANKIRNKLINRD